MHGYGFLTIDPRKIPERERTPSGKENVIQFGFTTIDEVEQRPSTVARPQVDIPECRLEGAQISPPQVPLPQHTTSGLVSRTNTSETIHQREVLPFSAHENKKIINNNARQEINHYLIYFKCVESNAKQLILESKRFSFKNIEDLKALRDNLQVLIRNIQQFQLEYQDDLDSIQHDPKYVEVLQSIDVITDIYERLNDIPKQLDQEVNEKPEYFLCSILGLDEWVAEQLLSIPSETKRHQSNQYWIENYFDERGKELTDCNLKSTELCLVKLGFNGPKAKLLSELIDQHPYGDHKTVVEWAKEHIEDCYRSDILLNPYQWNYNQHNTSKTLRADYTIPVETDNDAINNVKACDLIDSEKELLQYVSEYKNSNEDFEGNKTF